MYWEIGRHIVEEEQNGKERADYGAFLLKNLAEVLEKDFGSGFSIRQLELCRQFFNTFSITNTLRSQLNWTQYKLLLRIDDSDKRTYISKKPAATTGVQDNWKGKLTVSYTNGFCSVMKKRRF